MAWSLAESCPTADWSRKMAQNVDRWAVGHARGIRSIHKQASHWHDEQFTSWHAIWRVSEDRTRDSRLCVVAWRCASDVVRAMMWRKF